MALHAAVPHDVELTITIVAGAFEFVRTSTIRLAMLRRTVAAWLPVRGGKGELAGELLLDASEYW